MKRGREHQGRTTCLHVEAIRVMISELRRGMLPLIESSSTRTCRCGPADARASKSGSPGPEATLAGSGPARVAMRYGGGASAPSRSFSPARAGGGAHGRGFSVGGHGRPWSLVNLRERESLAGGVSEAASCATRIRYWLEDTSLVTGPGSNYFFLIVTFWPTRLCRIT
jgi:hypothetical protein